MKNVILLLLLVPLFSWGQTTHKVGPKETLFSIGRQYNVHPRELAAYNNISFESGLSIGQTLKIPGKKAISPVNTIAPEEKKEVPQKQVVAKSAASNSVPVYHKVQKKESLYQISRLYNNVPVADIKKWNRLTTDGLNVGDNLIVGYTKPAKEPAIKIEPENVVVNKSVPKENDPVKVEKPVVNEKIKSIPQPEAVIKAEPQIAAPVKVADTKTNPGNSKNFNGGYFRQYYYGGATPEKVTEEAGTAATFKSTSGWEDGKYYCLHNTAASGTIIKIINKSNQKAVYAKVLDVIPDLKQNNGILIRISNAAADELGGLTDTFEVMLNY